MTNTVATTVLLTSIVTITPDQLTCELDGESVILHAREGVYYGLDAVGTVAWNAMTSPVSVGELRNVVLKRFDVTSERCTQDLIALVEDLVEHGLVVISAG